MQLTDLNEKKRIDKIITLGCQKAASSFSSLTGQKVQVEKTFVELSSDHGYLVNSYSHLKDLTILQTDVIGELEGCSYLVFNEEGQKTISEMSLAAFGSPGSIDGAAVLREIDNIIAAAVITELSNALKVNIYGDVPRLFKLGDMKDFHNHLNQGNYGYYLLAHTNFIFADHVMISPLFIWEIDKKIIDLVKT